MRTHEQPNRSRGGRASAQPHHGGVSAAEIEKYLKGMEFPCDKSALLQQARDNQAPDEVLDLLEDFPEQQFDSVIEVARGISQTKH